MNTLSTITVGDVVRRARLHHPAFGEDRHPDLVAVEYLSTRQRELLQQISAALLDRLSESRNVAATIAGSLVGVDANGAAYAITTADNGYAVAVDAVTGVLYLDFSVIISKDPFTAGFPLPAQALELVHVYAELKDSQRWVPVTIVPQRDVARRGAWGTTLYAIVNAWRLVPIKPPPANAGPSEWDLVKSVTVTWVDTPTRLSITGAWRDQLFVLPDIYAEALQYDLSAFLARREQGLNTEFPEAFVASQTTEAGNRLGAALKLAERDHQPVRLLQNRRAR